MWRTKLLYLLLTGIIFLFSILYLPEFSVYLMICVLLLPIGFFAAAHWTGTRLRIRLSAPQEPIALGTPIPFTISITNPDRLPIGTAVVICHMVQNTVCQEIKQTFNTAIPAKGTAQMHISVTPEHCGQIQLILRYIRVFDCICLFSHRKSMGISATAVVLPVVNPPEQAFATAFFGKSVPMQPTEEPEEFLGIREYRTGDRMRAIHWKLSSRFSNPVVREYGVPVQTPIAVGLLYALTPNQPEPGARLDAMLEAALAFAYAICQNGQPMTLICCGTAQHESLTISDAGAIAPLLCKLLASKPETNPYDCWNQLEQIGEQIPFCIADCLPEQLYDTQGLVANAASVPSGQLALVSGAAAKTVYHLLTTQERGLAK